MLRTIAFFELRYHLRRISTWVAFVFMAAIPLIEVSTWEGEGAEVINAAVPMATLFAGLGAFGVIMVSAICGTAVYRDIEDRTYELFFTTPIRTRAYIIGRLAGSLLVVLLIFAGTPLGAWVGSIAPWADHEHILRAGFWFYLQPYLAISATTGIALGTLFFSVGVLTRNAVVIYLQGVICLVVYLGVAAIAPGLDGRWAAWLDPFGFATITEVTRYWTLSEMNTQLVPVGGLLLANRALWLGIGAVMFAAALVFFPRSAEALGSSRKRRPGGSESSESMGVAAIPVPLPAPMPRFGLSGRLTQFWTLTRVRLSQATGDLVFLAMVIGAIALLVVETWGQPLSRNLPVLPVTYLMTRGVGTLFLVVLTTVYAGEFVWRDRQLKSDQLVDTQPAPNWLTFASQFAALTIVQTVFLAVLALVGMAQQTWLGYYNYELPVYIKELALRLPELMAFSAMALCVQTIVPNKYVAHAFVVGLFLGPELLIPQLVSRFNWTFPAELYEYSAVAKPTYSDMNHYGPQFEAFVWLTTYWGIAAMLLAALAIRFARRGTDHGWRARWRRSSSPWTVRTGATVAVMLFLATGASIYDGLRTSARYISDQDNQARLARYERDYKRYERLPQPKITAVDVNADLSPGVGSFAATGTYSLVNKTAAPIATVHIQGAHKWIFGWTREITFDRPFTQTLADEDVGYRIFQLQTPLGPGESLRMSFKAGRDARRFDPSPLFVANGAFFDNGWFPDIGYQRGFELSVPADRRRQGLPPQEDLPPVSDAWARTRNLFSASADRILFRTTVSTDLDQVAVAPGYLVREWTEGGRRHFTYDMGETTMLNFYSFVSGRYAVHRDRWRDVDLQVFHHPGHPYNIARMVEATKAGLDYFTENFGPYPFRQFRILEFPRYRGFAQAFPNTVPFSEGDAFIGTPSTDEDLDLAFYITLHELAHQWWGHKVIGAFAEGSNILAEMMAEYSALMVLEHVLGPERARLQLKTDLDGYLNGRRFERRGEQTLARVTRQPYVWYQKGSLAMYALKDAIGEARLNAAIRAYVEKVQFQAAPYTTVEEFLATLRAATPPDKQSLITDLFETITLWDNRAVSATWRETPDRRYAVSFDIAARKLRADDQGQETEVPLNDDIDIGVFVGSGKDERPLFLEKRRITGNATIEVVVDDRPTRAGIDPYHKLIDRDSTDNTVAVTRQP